MGKLSPLLFDDFANDLLKVGKQIASQQMYLDENKWKLAKKVNDEWNKGGYEAEGTDKREYYKECCSLLPVMIFGSSGETLRRWSETQAHYAKEKNITTLLHGSSFDHLLKAKRLQAGGKVEAAILAVAFAIEHEMSADDMVSHFDPEHDGSDSRHFTMKKLFSLADRAWISREASFHLLMAARNMKEHLDSEVQK